MGGDLKSEAGAGGDSLGFQQLTSPSHPFSGMVPGTRTVCIDDSQCLMNPFGKSVGMKSTSSRLPLWPTTSSQRCNN